MTNTLEFGVAKYLHDTIIVRIQIKRSSGIDFGVMGALCALREITHRRAGMYHSGHRWVTAVAVTVAVGGEGGVEGMQPEGYAYACRANAYKTGCQPNPKTSPLRGPRDPQRRAIGM